MGRKQWTYAAGGAAILALCAGWVLGLLYPRELIGAAAWSATVIGVLYGFGAGARRLLAVDVGVGEQIVLGTIGWIFVTGTLMVFGLASRVPLFGLAAAGSIGAIYELVTRSRSAARAAAPNEGFPPYAALGVVVAVVLIINLLATVGTRGNPYDDHIAYTSFVKRLLDCGNVIEPFSFRRLSAYGGQTSLLALTGLRGDLETTDLTDRGIFQAIAVIVVLGLARRRKVHVGVAAVLAAFMVLEWDMSFNSACMWSGVAMFVAAYGFASRDDLGPQKSLVLAFAACAAACTLRQNYIAPAGLFAALLLVSHVRARARESTWRTSWTEERRTILYCLAIAGAIVVPYAISAWISNHTFLYPVLLGTGNPASPLRPPASSFLDELGFFFNVALNPDPFRIWWVVLPFMIVARDTRARRPWPAFLIACGVGWAILVHSFMLSDAPSLWRYAVGYMTPLMVVFVIEIADQIPLVDAGANVRLRLPTGATFLIWAAIAVQLAYARNIPRLQLQHAIDDIKLAQVAGSDKAGPAAELYRDMQDHLPEGGRVAVLLDDNYLLDYQRNEIFNLDLPGFAAPGPQMPAFLGPERWRSYFLSLGIRYLAWVDPGRSTYLYRRAAWFPRMFTDDNAMWQFMASHMVDIQDSFEDMAKTSHVLFDRDGLKAIDLGPDRPALEHPVDEPEGVRLDRYLRRVSETQFGNAAWQLASRSSVVFQPDWYSPSPVQLHIPETSEASDDFLAAAWDKVFGARPPEPPYRLLMERTHVRVHGNGHQHIHVKLWINTIRLFTRPNVTISLDGKLLAQGLPDQENLVTLDAETSCSGWCDLYIKLSTIGEFWSSPEYLRAVKLLELDWNETGS